jgi:hypothetical protein
VTTAGREVVGPGYSALPPTQILRRGDSFVLNGFGESWVTAAS